MILFLKKLALFLFILFVITGGYFLLIYYHPDFVDEVYYRFTTPKANSLIIGTSRSAVAIVPAIFNNNMFNKERKIINHSFAFGVSNYGPSYFREIKKKIQLNDTHDGLFIISVDPWGLAIDKSSPDDTSSFTEIKNKAFIGALSSSSENPNVEYLRKFWGNKLNPLIELFKRSFHYKNQWILKDDGWMDITVPCDSQTVKERIQNGMALYETFKMKLSDTRFNYLEQIIQFLSQEGNIYLVRLPVTSEMREMENKEFPEFDNRILLLTKKYNLKYFNFIDNNNYKFVDQHHMQKESAYLISEQICDSISLEKKTIFREASKEKQNQYKPVTLADEHTKKSSFKYH